MSTPMFEQYHQLKAAHPNAILFFRMGDFYEMFFEDAEVAARELDLTLTARNKQDPEPIPMAGVPHHASQGYIERLVAHGYRVAIAEQVEDPRHAKGLVRREVVRVVTPGVAFDPTTLDKRAPCWLASVAQRGSDFGLAFLDSSTGDFRCTVVRGADAAVAELQRMEPREALVAPEVDLREVAGGLGTIPLSSVETEAWTAREAARELHDALGVTDLAAFGVDPRGPAARAAGAALRYARDLLGGALGNVHRLTPYQAAGFMVIDDTTRRNLELVRTLIGGRRKGSLLALIDRCGSAAGSRLLRDWLMFPLLDIQAIRARQAAVEDLVEAPGPREDLHAALKTVADVERISARVAQGTAHARDLAGLRRSLQAVPLAVQAATGLSAVAPHLPTDPCADVLADLEQWLVDEPPQSVTDGGLIRVDVHAELAELARLSFEGVGIITELEAEERDQTGIATLKIKKNRVFGYFIEVTKAQVHRVPERYLRKQTLTNCERYITPELKELEEKVLGADERRKSLEYELFVALRDRVSEASVRLGALARNLATLDALTAMADCAVRFRWSRPEVDDTTELVIEAGRHPVVEQAMDEERFVPNDVQLDTAERQLVVLTGPNMAGKSTIMRQVALIAILAQVGSFVPADRARIGRCDRVFTRVGAADDLARGQSTFMVEMSETAAILHQATAHSLVVLDEIGRGTSTYDGLSIAWAVAEDLVDRIGCRAMFATHYHELCDLAETRRGVINQSVAVSELGEEILFLRRLKEGGASRSYGIQCARLAGLPRHVVDRATRLLTRFEKHAPRNEREQLSLFAFGGAPSPAEKPEPEAVDALRERLDAIDPDALTPRQALDLVYELRQLRGEGT